MDEINTKAVKTPVQTDTFDDSKDNVIEIEIPFPLFHYLGSEDCNIQNICRICLSTSDKVLFPLFSTGQNLDLADMFMGITEVPITADDGLPSNLCSTCKAQVVQCYEFKDKCVKANYTLKSILKAEFVSKNDVVKDEPEYHEDHFTCQVKDEDVKNEDEYLQEEDLQRDVMDSFTDIEYIENLKKSIKDDEALCIVQDTENNQRQVTIINNGLRKPKKGSRKQKKKTTLYCTICTKKFYKATALESHINKHHSRTKGRHPCEHCKEAFDSEHDLKLHGSLHSKDAKWKCTECQKEFIERTALRRHIQRHMNTKRFSCDRCDKTFVEHYALRRHSRVHTGEQPEKRHACHLCDKRYSDLNMLVTHVTIRHDDVRSFPCTACGKAFATARLLASHALVHSDTKLYACQYCDKRFRHESTRNTHHRTHTGERPYVCATCGKAFIQRSNMTLHMRTHTGERPYACSYCERKFSSGSTLKAHERTHTGERPYVCNVCGKSFARQNLKQHMRRHTGERAHACGACPKRFDNAARLRDHMRIHTGEKPYECATCSKKFITKSHLIKHVKQHCKKRKANKLGEAMFTVEVSDTSHSEHEPDKCSLNKYPEQDANQRICTAETPLEGTTEMMLRNDKPKRASTRGVMFPVTVSDKSISERKPNEYFIEQKVSEPPMYVIPKIPDQFCTVHDNPTESSNTEVVLLNGQNSAANAVSFVNDVSYSNDVNLVTVNEGTTLKLYQYDQSLLQIQTEGGNLTISRISSSKMTTNF